MQAGKDDMCTPLKLSGEAGADDERPRLERITRKTS